MTDPSPRTELAAVIERAAAMTAARLDAVADGPVRAMFASIAAQLEHMGSTIAAGGTPTIADRNRITLGVIAVREFEADDPDYCDALCDAAFRYRHLA